MDKRGKRTGRATRPTLAFESDEKVQMSLDAFTVKDDELKQPVQVSESQREGNKDGEEEEEEDDVLVLDNSVRPLRRKTRPISNVIVDEQMRLNRQLREYVSGKELLGMTMEDKRKLLDAFQQSQQVAATDKERRRAFYKEANLSIEDIEEQPEKPLKPKVRRTRQKVTAARGAPPREETITSDDSDDTQRSGDTFLTLGQTLDDKNPMQSMETDDKDEQAIWEEETQAYDWETPISEIFSKKRSLEDDGSNDSTAKKSRVDVPPKPASPRPMFDFEFDKKDLPPASPSPRKLVNKRRQKQKRLRYHFPNLFAPENQPPAEYTPILVKYFDEYFMALRDAQRRSSKMIEWGPPICEGRHMPGSLDVYRNKPRPVLAAVDTEETNGAKTLVNMTIDDAFSFDDVQLDPVPSTSSRSDRYYKRQQRRHFGEFDDIIESDDELKDPDFMLDPKPPPKRGRGKLRGTGTKRLGKHVVKKTNTDDFFGFEDNDEIFTTWQTSKSPVFSKAPTFGAGLDSDNDSLPELTVETSAPVLVAKETEPSIDVCDVNSKTVQGSTNVSDVSDAESDSLIGPGQNLAKSRSETPVSAPENQEIFLEHEEMEIDEDRGGKNENDSDATVGGSITDDMQASPVIGRMDLQAREKGQSPGREKLVVNRTSMKFQEFSQGLRDVVKRQSQETTREESPNDSDPFNLFETSALKKPRRTFQIETIRASDVDEHFPDASQDLFANDSPTFPSLDNSPAAEDFDKTDAAVESTSATKGIGASHKVDAKTRTRKTERTKNINESSTKPDEDSDDSEHDLSSFVNCAPKPKLIGSHMTKSAKMKTESQDIEETADLLTTYAQLPHGVVHAPKRRLGKLSVARKSVGENSKKQKKVEADSETSKVRKKVQPDAEGGDEESVASGSQGKRTVRPQRKRQKVEPVIEPLSEGEGEVEKVELVACPLCGDSYPMTEIEMHAAGCDGIPQKIKVLEGKVQTRSATTTQEDPTDASTSQPTPGKKPGQRRPSRNRRKKFTDYSTSSDSDDDPGVPKRPKVQYGSPGTMRLLREQKDLDFDAAKQIPPGRRPRPPPAEDIDYETCFICESMVPKGREYQQHIDECIIANESEQQRMWEQFKGQAKRESDNNLLGGLEDAWDKVDDPKPGNSGYQFLLLDSGQKSSAKAAKASTAVTKPAVTSSSDETSDDGSGSSTSDSSSDDDGSENLRQSPAFQRKNENDFDWDAISTSPIKGFRPLSKQTGLLVDLNKQFPHQRKKDRNNNQGTLSEFGIAGSGRGRKRGARGGKTATGKKRKRKTKRKTKTRKKRKVTKAGKTVPPAVHIC